MRRTPTPSPGSGGDAVLEGITRLFLRDFEKQIASLLPKPQPKGSDDGLLQPPREP